MASPKGLCRLSSVNQSCPSYTCPLRNPVAHRLYLHPPAQCFGRAKSAFQWHFEGAPTSAHKLCPKHEIPDDAAYPSSATPSWSRRATLLSLPILGGILLPEYWTGGAWAALNEPLPRPLRSFGWSVPSELTIFNDLDGPLKVYWLNYNGDAEYFRYLRPSSVFTVRAFESHAWRFVDDITGSIVAEHITAAGQQVVRMVHGTAAVTAVGSSATDVPATALYTYTVPRDPVQKPFMQYTPVEAQPQQPPGVVVGSSAGAASQTSPPEGGGGGVLPVAAFDGFDGLGNDEQQYRLAQPQDIEFFTDGTDVLLDFPGGGYPMKLTLEPDDIDFESVKGSLNWLHQSSTLSTLSRSLMASGVELRRVCITRMVGEVLYCRLVLLRPDASLCSVDASLGDSLSLALQMRRPIYVANQVSGVYQSIADVYARRREAKEAAASNGGLSSAIEAAVDKAAQEELDSIFQGIPSAPQEVRTLDLDWQLEV